MSIMNCVYMQKLLCRPINMCIFNQLLICLLMFNILIARYMLIFTQALIKHTLNILGMLLLFFLFWKARKLQCLLREAPLSHRKLLVALIYLHTICDMYSLQIWLPLTLTAPLRSLKYLKVFELQ